MNSRTFFHNPRKRGKSHHHHHHNNNNINTLLIVYSWYDGCLFCNVCGPAICKLYKPHRKKLVSGESSKSHSSTMQKVVMVSSAMLLYDVIKNVMTSTVPEEKKIDPKAKWFRCYVFSRVKLEIDRMEVHAELTGIRSQLCFVLYRLHMD